ncbi:FMN-dependent NADH-azoreductase [Alteromonas antoniana]|uniref:FMN-dependent NADH-azoreductase n=1 Tax=Alteromonas antoniana TaxID=2803813 RepID=UPI001C46904D|nr:NAD(P)H-dependent oxidoreductase [Alteromonas antoniana]
MRNVLAITTSLNKAQGNSNKLVASYVEKLSSQPATTITRRDLDEDSLPHLTAEEMQAWMTPSDERTDEQHALAALSDSLVEEVKTADDIVIGVPMYNFGIPSVMKAWIDRIARAGVTFRYTETGPVGLLENKSVTILAARGGQYSGTEYDTQSQYLTHFFNFIGITDIQFVYAEGLALGEESAKSAFDAANQKIIELTAQRKD